MQSLHEYLKREDVRQVLQAHPPPPADGEAKHAENGNEEAVAAGRGGGAEGGERAGGADE